RQPHETGEESDREPPRPGCRATPPSREGRSVVVVTACAHRSGASAEPWTPIRRQHHARLLSRYEQRLVPAVKADPVASQRRWTLPRQSLVAVSSGTIVRKTPQLAAITQHADRRRTQSTNHVTRDSAAVGLTTARREPPRALA